MTLSAAGVLAAAGGGVAAAASQPPAPRPATPSTPDQQASDQQAPAQQASDQQASDTARHGEHGARGAQQQRATSPQAEQAGETLATELGSAVGGVLRPVKDLQLNPLARTGVDPLDNSLGAQIADFRPVSTEVLTRPLTEGGSLEDLPIVGAVSDVLPG